MRDVRLALAVGAALSALLPARSGAAPAEIVIDFDSGRGGIAPAAIRILQSGSDGVPAVPDDAVAYRPNPLAGLKLGAADAAPNGAVARLQSILLDRWLFGLLPKDRKAWFQNIPKDPRGRYGAGTFDLLTLFKVIYGTGRNGGSVDPKTAEYLLAIEDGTFARIAPTKSAGAAMLYNAAQFLGAPYNLPADGTHSMDCGLLTKRSLLGAGVWRDDGLTRAADLQLRYAVYGENNLVERPKTAKPLPGDLVFYDWETRQSNDPGIFRRITHVGLALGNDLGPGETPLTLEATRPFVAIKRRDASLFAGMAEPLDQPKVASRR